MNQVKGSQNLNSIIFVDFILDNDEHQNTSQSSTNNEYGRIEIDEYNVGDMTVWNKNKKKYNGWLIEN